MSKTNEKILYFIGFIIMFKTILFEMYIFFLYLLYQIFQDIVKLFGGEKPSDNIFNVIPPELFLIIFVVTVISVFILGFIDKWRWIGAMIIIVFTISICALSFYSFDDINITNIGGVYVAASFTTIIFPAIILFYKFKSLKQDTIEDSQESSLIQSEQVV